jgi:hypothetical protein
VPGGAPGKAPLAVPLRAGREVTLHVLARRGDIGVVMRD